MDEDVYEIEFDRGGCIGSGACATANSDNWKMDPDGKATVLKKEISKDELEANLKAARGCPVSVIRIKNKTTGQYID